MSYLWVLVNNLWIEEYFLTKSRGVSVIHAGRKVFLSLKETNSSMSCVFNVLEWTSFRQQSFLGVLSFIFLRSI